MSGSLRGNLILLLWAVPVWLAAVLPIMRSCAPGMTLKALARIALEGLGLSLAMLLPLFYLWAMAGLGRFPFLLTVAALASGGWHISRKLKAAGFTRKFPGIGARAVTAGFLGVLLVQAVIRAAVF